MMNTQTQARLDSLTAKQLIDLQTKEAAHAQYLAECGLEDPTDFVDPLGLLQ